MSDHQTEKDGMRYLLGNDALNMLIDIYMDGFMTGASSALATYTSVDDATSDRLCEHLTAGLRDDPLAVETIRREITERFQGIDSGEKTFTLAAKTPYICRHGKTEFEHWCDDLADHDRKEADRD